MVPAVPAMAQTGRENGVSEDLTGRSPVGSPGSVTLYSDFL